MTARTFVAKHDERAALVRGWFGDVREPKTYPTPVVWVEPAERKNDDGSTSVSLGFPLLAITSHTNDGLKVAELVARLLTEHYAKAEEPA